MKRLMILLAASILLAACTTTQYVPVVETHDVHHYHTDSVIKQDSTVHEKETTIMQLDSAAMAKYGIQLKSAERAWLVKTKELERQIERLMAMSETKDSVHDSIPVPYPVETIKEVPADLSWWQQTRIHIANIFLWILAIAAVAVLITRRWLKKDITCRP